MMQILNERKNYHLVTSFFDTEIYNKELNNYHIHLHDITPINYKNHL